MAARDFAWGEGSSPTGDVTHRELDVTHPAHGRAQWFRHWGKRLVDIVVSAVLLALLLPVLAVVVLAIFVESPGPVFFRCERVGRFGRPLRMLKFRKMRLAATGPRLTLADDPRFTRVGRLLARTKLDELPQLWHVLVGDMSLIGPRPEDPAFVACRPEDFREILTVRPGMSGLSQLAFARESSLLPVRDPVSHYVAHLLPQKCALDLLYARNLTMRADLRITLWTLVAVGARQPVAVDREAGTLSFRRRRRSRASLVDGGALEVPIVATSQVASQEVC